jgi:hypothetical protein
MADITVSVSDCGGEKGVCLIELSVYGKSWKVIQIKLPFEHKNKKILTHFNNFVSSTIALRLRGA